MVVDVAGKQGGRLGGERASCTGTLRSRLIETLADIIELGIAVQDDTLEGDRIALFRFVE
jgi:tryptophan synthase alpha subunit